MCLANGTVVVVADAQALELRAFDERGAHLWTAGRGGEGPSEFTGNITLLSSLGGDSLLASDAGQRMNVAAAGECGALMADRKGNLGLRSVLGRFRACTRAGRELGGGLRARMHSRRLESILASSRKSVLLQGSRQVGVLNGLLGNFVASPDRIGRLSEHLVYTQLVHSAAAFDDDVRISTFRTEHGAEVDFIVERGADVFAIKVKASRAVAASDLRGLERFADYYGKPHRRMVWYLGKEPKRMGDVDILPCQQWLSAIGW